MGRPILLGVMRGHYTFGFWSPGRPERLGPHGRLGGTFAGLKEWGESESLKFIITELSSLLSTILWFANLAIRNQ